MMYEKPKMEIILLETEDVIRTSMTDGGVDDGSGEGNWGEWQ